jgi:hypothetical protein
MEDHMADVLFLSISGLFYALRCGKVSSEDLGSALIFANHARHQFQNSDSDFRACADSNEELIRGRPHIERADRQGRVDWAKREGSHTARRSWRQLNSFLACHGLDIVSEAGNQYTTGEAQRRVLAANPSLRIFS